MILRFIQHDVEVEELFELLEESIELNKAVGDAMPHFVKLCSYEHFCVQMEAEVSNRELI